MGRITVLFRGAGNQNLKLREMDNTLDAFQKAVKGYIETIRIRKDIICVINDEGKYQGCLGNFWCDELNDMVVGDVVFASFNREGEFLSLNQEQIDFVQKYIGFPVDNEKSDV